MKILVAEDDENIRRGLVDLLEDEGYSAIPARDGTEALALFASHSPDMVCLDIMMPGVSGYDVCRRLRERSSVPILFISAKACEIDKVLGLELGGDDFITKPFGLKEVLARIRAITRRCQALQPADRNAPFGMGDLDVLPAELRARRAGTTIELSLRDVKILRLLKAQAGKVVTRDELYDQCWGMGHLPNSRTVDQHVSQLRKRVERDARNPVLIRTVHGAGYRYEE